MLSSRIDMNSVKGTTLPTRNGLIVATAITVMTGTAYKKGYRGRQPFLELSCRSYTVAASFFPLQHSHSSQQFFLSSPVADVSLFFIGHESPQQSQHL